jgi:superfamily II DNA or RNA helicase
MELRGYQTAAKDAVAREWERVRRTLLVLPTGTGKTVVFSALARDVVARGGRVLILAHREELLRQAAEKLMRGTGLACAVEKAEECASGCLERVVVGSVQTLLTPGRRQALAPPTHVIVDEAHHAISESYQAVLREWPEARVLGVTATPDRGDLRELGSFFESLAFEYPLPRAIADGFLCPIRALTLPVAIDLRGVKVSAGDWTREQCALALEPYLPELTRLFAEHARDRKGLVFVPLCATGRKVVDAFRAHGLRAYYCDGEERGQIATWEADGPGSVMVNAMLLTEGYDHPPIDAIAVWRFTRSRSFYCQMVGRGTRIHPGKDRLLLVDNLYLTERHSLCRPAHLVADDEEVAGKLCEAAERDPGGGMDLDDEAVRAAQEDVVRDREAALAKKLAEMRHRRRELVDPVQYAVSVGAAGLVEYRPALPAEAAPPSREQVEALSKAGIYPGDVEHAGHAAAILATLAERKAGGYASPKQVRRLEAYGWTRAGQMTYAAAQKVISRIAANGWRVPAGLVPDGETPALGTRTGVATEEGAQKKRGVP